MKSKLKGRTTLSINDVPTKKEKMGLLTSRKREKPPARHNTTIYITEEERGILDEYRQKMQNQLGQTLSMNFIIRLSILKLRDEL